MLVSLLNVNNNTETSDYNLEVLKKKGVYLVLKNALKFTSLKIMKSSNHI